MDRGARRPPAVPGASGRGVRSDDALSAFRALSDPTRVEILDRIASGAQVTVTELAGVLPMTRQAVAKHLKVLEEAGLVAGERQGREHRYRLRTAPLHDAGDWLERRAAGWDGALQRLADFLDE